MGMMIFKKNKLTIDNTVDEICFEILKALKNPAEWVIQNLEYTHIDGIIAIKWGIDDSYDSSYMHNEIFRPDELKIPKKWHKEFNNRVQTIRQRKNNLNNKFMLDRISGKYPYSIEFKEIIDEIEIETEKWLIENINGRYYYQQNQKIFWFGIEDEAMAFKLRWF